MFEPDSKKLIYWQLVILIISVFLAIYIPLSIVFNFSGNIYIDSINLLITILYGIDIWIHFNTAYSSHGKHITDKRLISKRYLKTWFWVDLIAFFPYGLLFKPLSMLGIPFLLNFLRVLRLVKLFRVTRGLERIVSNRVNPAILRLFMLVFWILMTAHFISCLWLSIRPEEPLHWIDRYVLAFYWTITTLTTIGYGDISPQGTNQILFTILIELIGASFFGLIIGNIANLIVNIDVAKNQFKERVEKVNTFLKYRTIPYSVQKKINDYYQYLWESRRGYEENSVLADLPEPLKVTVSLFLNREIIEKVPLFEGASDEFIKEVILNLEPVVYSPKDYVVRAGEVGYDMFFLSKGSVEVISADEKDIYATLREGQFFGEIALLLSTPRTATVRTLEYCDLYKLHKDTFDRILTRYPDFEKNIRKLSEERKAEIAQLKKNV